jgi:hypothetical protein
MGLYILIEIWVVNTAWPNTTDESLRVDTALHKDSELRAIHLRLCSHSNAEVYKGNPVHTRIQCTVCEYGYLSRSVEGLQSELLLVLHVIEVIPDDVNGEETLIELPHDI